MADLEQDVLPLVGAETGHRYRERVGARRQVGKSEVAGLIGLSLLGADQSGAGELYRCLDNYRDAWIPQYALQSCRRFLCERTGQEHRRDQYHLKQQPLMTIHNVLLEKFNAVA